MTISSPTEAVMAIGRMNITGNVIPASWWRHITLPSGRPDQTAITLLSEIVYWYRPGEVRDEVSGALVGYRKRFHGDKLQRSYQAFADQFGFSKREATDALKRLKSAGLITLELRTVKTSEGMMLSNVLFIEPVPDAIDDINSVVRKSDPKNVTPVPVERNTPSISTETLLRPDVGDPTLKRETYTETTTENTTEIKGSPCPETSSPDEQLSLSRDDFLKRHPEAVVMSPARRQWGSQDDLTCAQWMWRRVLKLYEQAATFDGEVVRPKEPNWTAWANDVRLMREQDGRSHKQICELFRRVQNDTFWVKQVKCPDKLREKWDDLVIRLGGGALLSAPRNVNAISKPDTTIPPGFRG